MAIHEVHPGSGIAEPESVRPGDRIELTAGTHQSPLMISGLRGTVDAPIVIAPTGSGAVTVSGPMTEDAAKTFLNKEAKRRQGGGYYPAPGHLGDLAAITLRDCQFVLVDALYFRQCWPTAIYIDDCRFIGVRNCRIEGSTIAIGINGQDTRHVLVEGNHWQQDMSDDNKLWNSIPWSAVHGSTQNGGEPVDVEADKRHFDGDFLRAWDIAGDLTVRGNDVKDAFNGIHVFNRVDQISPGIEPLDGQFNEFRRASANILIENNRFTRIRDNIFEPEYHAWNWVIRHNKWLDCFAPFSFEFHRAGWFYVYGNAGLAIRAPSKDVDNQPRSSFAMFKSGGLQRNEGPIHVMFNAFGFPPNQRYFRRGALGHLKHHNNAIQFHQGTVRLFDKNGSDSGPGPDPNDPRGLLAGEIDAESNRFTRRWDGSILDGTYADEDAIALSNLQIEMDGDTINDANFPETYKTVGYTIGEAASGASADIPIPQPWPTDANEVSLIPQSSEVLGQSVRLEVAFPDGGTHEIPAGLDRGAHQTSKQGVDAIKELDALFSFLPDFGWADAVPAMQRALKRDLVEPVAMV